MDRPYENESDEDLILLMTFKEEDVVESEKAFNEFFGRYKDSLWRTCFYVCSHIPKYEHKILAEEVFNNTFYKIYEKAHLYNECDRKENVEVHIKAWINKIAENELNQLLREQQNSSDVLLGKDVISLEEISVEVTYENEQETSSYRELLVEEAINSIQNEEHRDIFRICSLYKEEGKKLPSNILRELENTFDKTAPNIRQIYKRCKEKVINHIKKSEQKISSK